MAFQTGKNMREKNKISLVIAAIHLIIVTFAERMVFTARIGDKPFNYIICKAASYIVLFLVWRAILAHSEKTKAILKYALIYAVPIAAVLVFKLPQGFLSNDETLIFSEARQLADYTWFYYLTTYYYIISMMIIPAWFGPILIKVAIQLLVCGYSVYRLEKYIGFKYGKFIYLAFMIPPVLAYTTSAHRIPIYFLLYLFLVFKLLMDKIENVEIDNLTMVWMTFLGAVLTQWRTEGIYLLALVPILMFIVYPNLRNKRGILGVVFISLMMQYLVQIPQNGVLPMGMDSKANDRMGPFYAYTITNMFRNGLDEDKNKEDIERVGRYLDIDTIKAINRDLGDINYEDVLILYYVGYTGKKEDAAYGDYVEYTKGCINIFKNNPDVLLRTRIGAFDYAATPYDIKWEQGGIKGFALFCVSIVKTIAYNLYIPHILLVLMGIYALVKRRWYTFFLAGGLLCHFIIVFVLAPASYFKYYFPIYMTMYFLTILVMISLVWSRNNDKKVTFLQ